MSGDTETPTGLAPSADLPGKKRARLNMGRGALMLICGAALAAFAIYAFIVMYGLYAAQ